eukprot:5479458-Prymnesium_polylepis.1
MAVCPAVDTESHRGSFHLPTDLACVTWRSCRATIPLWRVVDVSLAPPLTPPHSTQRRETRSAAAQGPGSAQAVVTQTRASQGVAPRARAEEHTAVGAATHRGHDRGGFLGGI